MALRGRLRLSRIGTEGNTAREQVRRIHETIKDR
jgi:hypothetical protein